MSYSPKKEKKTRSVSRNGVRSAVFFGNAQIFSKEATGTVNVIYFFTETPLQISQQMV